MKPSADHALILAALERWKASGRSRDSLSRLVGVPRGTFARWAANPQLQLRLEAQRSALMAIAYPPDYGAAARETLEALMAHARQCVELMPERRQPAALQLWESIVPELLALRAQLRKL